jgi:dUTP pyrophosphatase
MTFKVFLVDEKAKAPTKGSPYAAAHDLYSCEQVLIPAHSRKLVNTGVILQVDKEDCYLRVAPRSGLSVKGIDIGAGVVDYDYRGRIKVLMINHTSEDYTVDVGDRIAQLITERIYTDEFVDSAIDEMTDTQRGVGGFGSTGK